MSTRLAEILERIERRLEAIERRLSDSPDDLIGVQGAMAMTGLSKSGIYQKTCSHDGQPPEIPHYKAGKRLYFRRTELASWMTRQPVKDRKAIEEDVERYMEGSVRKRKGERG